MTTSDNVNDKLVRYQVDHLVLLVGRNPLPNAVAGVLLTKSGGRISLIYSKGTAGIRGKLQKYLDDRGFHANEDHEVDAAKSPSIIKGVLKCLKASDETVGLHYTGGTKAMSVHAFRALETWAKENNKHPVFSYLDSRTLQVRIDPNAPKGGGNQVPISVGLEIEIEVEELIRLHGWTLRTTPLREPILPKTAEELANVCSKNSSLEAWRCWKSAVIDNDDKKYMLQKKWHGSTSNVALSDDASLSDLWQTLLTGIGQSGSSVLDMDKAIKDGHFRKIKHFCGWLDGKWLEHHLLKTLKDLTPSLKLHSCMQNVVPAEVEFDLDVVAMRGYQLFGFSCSTDGDGAKARLKMKLFEVYVRATQLGGDEARVALICTSGDPASIETEMQRSFNDEGRIKVFVQEHLANLSGEIEEWIISQEGKE